MEEREKQRERQRKGNILGWRDAGKTYSILVHFWKFIRKSSPPENKYSVMNKDI